MTLLGVKVTGARHLGGRVMVDLDLSHADLLVDWVCDGHPRRTTVRSTGARPAETLSIPAVASSAVVLAVDDMVGSNVTLYLKYVAGKLTELEVQGAPGTPRLVLPVLSPPAE